MEPVGRTSELREVERFLSPHSTGRVLVLAGDAGIGKSVLWGAGVERARLLGMATLCARAGEAEAQLSFAGLADLLDAIDPSMLAELPPSRRRPLDVAVGRADPADRPVEPLAIAAGLLEALRLVSARESVLVAIDDLPFLDSASASALVFAARRLASLDVRYLVSRRSGLPSDLERVLEPSGVVLLELGPLGDDAISRLLSDRIEQTLPRRVFRQVYETSGGNPLFAVELGRAAIERGLPEIGAALSVPAALEELFGPRVAALTPDVRRALLAVALSAGLSGEELAAITDPLAIEDARAARVLTVDGTRVRASHPLLAAAASRQSSARERRDLHLALAEAVGDEVLRARHLAMAASSPNAALAGELSAVAGRAAARGSVQEAAEVAGHALRLTPPGGEEQDERLLALARYLISSGEHGRARALLEERIERPPPGRTRAAAHLLLAQVVEIPAEGDHLTLAIAEGATDPGLLAQALATRAELLTVGHVRRLAEAEQDAREALAVAGSAGPEAERRALVALAWARIVRGSPIDNLLDRSAAPAPVTLSLHESSLERLVGVRLAFRGELAQAGEIFRRLLAVADERGEWRSRQVLLVQLCELELRAGRSSGAVRALDEWGERDALELPEASGTWARLRAALAALQGEPQEAEVLAARVLEAGESDAHGWDRLEALRTRGLAALLERRFEQAAADLGAVWEHMESEGITDPGVFPVAGDLVEALAVSGPLDAANQVLARLGSLVADQHHPWGLATVRRSTAVVTLADGYDEAAAAELAQAADDYRTLECGFESARALLFLGRVQRRSRKRAAARQSLERARSGFAELGCPGWEQAARAELERISGRRKTAEGGLTPSEQRVAELVASGLSNKEIAGQLFVSVYTVEAHLSSVYAKLGVHSRTKLARQLRAPA